MADKLFNIPHTGVPTSKSAMDMVAKAMDEDEPVFVLLAKDFFAVQVIAHYLELVEKFAPTNHEFQEEIVNIQTAVRSWQADNIERVRYPD